MTEHRLEYTLTFAGENTAHCVCGWNSEPNASVMHTRAEYDLHEKAQS